MRLRRILLLSYAELPPCRHWLDACCCAENHEELNEEEIIDHPMADAALPIPVTTVAAASACIGRVLHAVHNSLSRLLTEDDLQLHCLEVARHHLAGKDEAAELQVMSHDHACSLT